MFTMVLLRKLPRYAMTCAGRLVLAEERGTLEICK